LNSNQNKTYVEVILPLSLAGAFTYEVPLEFQGQVQVGIRVEVEFGKRKHYAAIVKKVHNTTHWEKPKPILAIIDEKPIINAVQLEFWEWMSQYYLCHVGEVMAAALPSTFKLQSETCLIGLLEQQNFPEGLEDDEYQILEALDIRKEITVFEVQAILQKKSVLKLIKRMIENKWIASREKLEDRSAILTTQWIRLHHKLQSDKDAFNQILDHVQRSEKQTRSLLLYLQIKKEYGWIKRRELQKLSKTDSSVTDAILKKEIYEEMILDKYEYPNASQEPVAVQLNAEQKVSYDQIKESWKTNSTVLLHGVTGSGKTMIYLKIIQEILAAGKQILYLVPEIALTSQLVLRLKQYLGDDLLEYHSELSIKSKEAVWNAALKLNRVFIGARSALFLPFDNLGLILVDEEHDASYKQNDPAPRYNARDSAIVLSRLFKANVLLGTATPSVESYYNAQQSRYGSVVLSSRYGDSELPEIETVSMKEAQQFGKLKGFFTQQLLDEIQSQLDQEKQVIIFRNRRGYSPLLQCSNCNWEASCDRCDIRMTLHKHQEKLKCHICGNQKPIPERCPNCGQFTLKILGFGTEKIEEELQVYFPDKTIHRLDLDVARSRKMQQKIIEDFQEKEIDILVGTQMVTKGLDFVHVGLVGVMQADQILFYPDFRSQERAFQLFTQVSGRAGRRKDRGKVLIQGFNIFHPVVQDVIQHDHNNFYQRELLERKKFNYPPYVRLIKIQMLHLKLPILEDGIKLFYDQLKALYGKRILGPAEPHVSRIKGSYIREILIKIEKDADIITKVKMDIMRLSQELKSKRPYSSLRIQVDVDP
jgi:primosomal protein N' (replication factor Y)